MILFRWPANSAAQAVVESMCEKFKIHAAPLSRVVRPTDLGVSHEGVARIALAAHRHERRQLGLTLTRGWANESRTHIRGAVHIVLVVILLQAAHFVEELSAGLHERLPALFGLPPMSLQFFVSFNVAWLAIWSLSSWGLATHYRAALFPLWFLGIGCVVNGVAHRALSILAGGYFPGLVTFPVVGILGVVLLRRLRVVTSPSTD